MNKKIKILAKSLFAVIASVVVMVVSLPASALSADAIPYGTPKIDGTVEKLWNGASNKIAIDFLNEGEDTGTTAYARLMWDEKFLYVLGYVNDKTVSTKVVGDSYWNTDSFEVFLDEENAHNTDKNSISQFRIDRSSSFTGMLNNKAIGEKEMLAEYKGSKWAAKKISSSAYAVEFAIAWTRVKNVKKGNMIGIEFQINDDANNDGTRECVVNSEVNYKGLWTSQAYRMMTLTDVKATDLASSSNNTSSSDKGNTSSNDKANTSSSDKGNTSSNDKANTSSNDKGNTSQPGTTSTDDKTDAITSNDNQGVTDTQDNTQSTDNTASNAGAQTVVIEEKSDSSTLIIVAIVVGAVVLITAGVCVALLLKKPKK